MQSKQNQGPVAKHTRKMNKLLILFGLLLHGNLSAQKHDNVWPGGLNEYPGAPANGNYLIRFDNGSPVVDAVDLKMNFESTVAAISDSTGKLLYYTNGCSILNGNGDTINNGTGLNPGKVYDRVCPEKGYISPRGAMFLPMPGYEAEGYFLFHMAVDDSLDLGLSYGPLYFSLIIVGGGLSHTGNVLVKNEEILPVIYAPVYATRIYEPFSVVRHGNGRDWWLVVPEYAKNIYHTFLIRKGPYVDEMPIQTIGTPMKCKRIGSSTFSPDGSKYARQQNCGITVMDFNRCTGKFSNPKLLSRPGYSFHSGGVAFSPDNSKLVTNSYLTILEADLNQATPTFDTLVYSNEIAGASLHYMQFGPDGNLYFSALHRMKSMPEIKDPFSDNPTYVQNELPVYSVRTLPNFPNYRLYDFPNSPCDTLGINTPVSATEPKTADDEGLKLFPNPANDYLEVLLPQTWSGSIRLEIYTAGGGHCLTRKFDPGEGSCTIATNSLPNGLYFCRVISGELPPLSATFMVVR